MELTVTDNGKGLDTRNAASPRGLGLTSTTTSLRTCSPFAVEELFTGTSLSVDRER